MSRPKKGDVQENERRSQLVTAVASGRWLYKHDDIFSSICISRFCANIFLQSLHVCAAVEANPPGPECTVNNESCIRIRKVGRQEHEIIEGKVK